MTQEQPGKLSRRGFLKIALKAAAGAAILGGTKAGEALAQSTEPVDFDKKREELKSNPEYFEGFRNNRYYTDEASVEHRVYETVTLTQSGAWIIERDVIVDENGLYKPVKPPKLIKELEHWGPNSFEEDMKEVDEWIKGGLAPGADK